MFGLGFWEIAAILVIALLILGPKKLPDLARTVGKALRELRGATDSFTSTITEESRRPEPQLKAPEPAPIIPPTSEPASADPAPESSDETETKPEPDAPKSAGSAS